MASEHEMRDKDQRLNLANFPIRTDLAREAVDMAVQNRGDVSGIPGVQMDEHEEEGIHHELDPRSRMNRGQRRWVKSPAFT